MSTDLLIRLPDFFPSLINAMQDGFLLRDTDGTILDVNRAFCDMVGLEHSEIVGSRPPHAWWPNALHGKFEDGALHVLPEVSREVDLVYQRHSGDLFPVLVTHAPLRDSNERIIAFMGTIKDMSERVSAEEQIRFQAALIDQVKAGVIATDAAGTITYWNRGAESLYGWRSEDVIGKPARDLVVGPVSDETVADLIRTLNTGLPWEGEVAIPHRDGEAIPSLISTSAFLDQANRPIGIVGVAVDIVDRQRAENAVRESEHRFRTMADSAPVLLWVAGEDGRCTWCNNGWLEFTGRTLEQELGPGWREGVHPADVEQCLQTYRSSFAAREGFESEYRLRRHDGEYRWVFDRGIPRFDPDGVFDGFIGSCIDITDRKRHEEEQDFLAEATELLASSLDYRETLTSVAHLTVPTIADWCVVHAVGEHGAIDQIVVAHSDPAKEVWAREIQERYPSDPHAEGGIANVIRTRQPEVYSQISKDMLAAAAQDDEHLALLREVGFTSVMILPVVARERVLGVITLVSAERGRHFSDRDLALAQHLASRLAVAIDNALLYQDAQRAAHDRDQFLAVAAHELRSPLTSMKGFAQLLLRRAKRLPGGSEWITPLQTIDIQINRVTELVNRLLDVSRIEEERLRLQLESVDMVEVVRGAAVEAQLATEQHTVVARFADVAVVVSIDRHRIEQVLANLLDNAIKYSPANTTIEIVLLTDDAELVVAVSDEGPGIPLDAREHMFERYFRGTSSASSASEGLGLGLYVAHGIVTAHGGRMWVESNSGAGTTFSFALPLAAQDATDRLRAAGEVAEG